MDHPHRPRQPRRPPTVHYNAIMRWRAGLVLLLIAATTARAEPDEQRPAPVALEILNRRLDDPKQCDAAAVQLLRRSPSHVRAQKLVIAQLRHKEWYTRWRACLALAKAGPACVKRALPELLAAAISKERDIQHEARIALGKVAPDDQRLLRLWNHVAREKGWKAVPERVMGKVNRWRQRHNSYAHRAQVPSLIKLYFLRDYGLDDSGILRALDSPDPAVVGFALNEIRGRRHLDPRAYYPRVVAIRHGSEENCELARVIVRGRNAEHFPKLRESQGKPELRRLLKSSDPVHREAAARLLPHIEPGPNLEQRLCDLLAFDPDRRVRAAAMDALFVAARVRAEAATKNK